MRISLFVALALLSTCAAAQVQPGNWELSLIAMMTGQPKPAAVTQTRCLTDADARDPSRVVPGGSCEFTNKHDSGSVFTFDVSCTGALPMKGRGTVTYTSTTMNADLDLSADGGKFGARTFVTGRRLGGC
jgi:hypothetical protein